MDIASIIGILQIVVQELPGAITTTEQLVDLGKKFYASANGTDPTADEISQLEDAIDSDVAAALTPLPPE